MITFDYVLITSKGCLEVRTGDEALNGFVLVGVDLPWRVSVDFAVHWQVPRKNELFT
jgi:hypothetical protein